MENEQDIEAQMLEAMEQEAAAEAAAQAPEAEAETAPAPAAQAPAAPAQPAQPATAPAQTPATAQFEELSSAMLNADSAPLSTLYDLNLPISIELGRTSMKVQEVLQLGRGSVIELDRLAGEPVDIYVGDRRFAEGEVVVLGENFGVRITRILPANPTEVQ